MAYAAALEGMDEEVERAGKAGGAVPAAAAAAAAPCSGPRRRL